MAALRGARCTDTLSGFENVIGTFFNDNITGDGFDNGFDGLSGNDVIDGGDGIDTIYYGTWDNNGRAATLLVGINGSDPNGVTVDLLNHTANDGEGGTDTLTNIENVVGSKGIDTITGDAADNRIEGGAGADILRWWGWHERYRQLRQLAVWCDGHRQRLGRRRRCPG